MYKHILMPYDGSPLSDKALAHCVSLAKSVGAKVSLFYVVTPHHLLIGGGRGAPGLRQLEHIHRDEFMAHAREMLDAARKLAEAAGAECNVLVEEGTDPYEQIIAAAQRLHCDLVLMASHGRKGLEALLVGSETVKVLTHSQIPVLVVR